jgi:hypothetical protein
MTPEVLHAFLWRARCGLRTEGLPLLAGHGIADPNYRPAHLPYVSVLGPLGIDTESERELPERVFLWTRVPGCLLGATREETQAIPDGGPLRLRFDTDATVEATIALADLAGQTFGDTNGPLVAQTIEAAVRDAVDAGQVTMESGALDGGRQAELRALTVRWDRHRSRIVIASGRRGTLERLDARVGQISRVEVLNPDAGLVVALGLGARASLADGRILRHEVANPTALGLDVRLDLWAGTQHELAMLIDAWCRMTPNRGQLLIRPGLLAEDLVHGATELRLQRRGESPNPATLLQLETDRGFADRISARLPTLLDGAAVDAAGLRLSGNASATLPVYERSAIPYPWREGNPGPDGFAATLGLVLDEDPDVGEHAQVVQLRHGERTVLELRMAVSAAADGESPHLDLIAGAQRDDGTDFAESRARVALARARTDPGIQVHCLVSAMDGRTRVFVDGVLGAPPEDFVAGAPAPGSPSGGTDMELLLGDPDGVAPTLRILHLQLHARPLGPTDPRLRDSLAGAETWRAGEPLTLARSSTGYSSEGEAFTATVVAIHGDRLVLDRPVQGDWPLAETLVYQRGLFFAQKQFRRRDDFMNQVYRVTVEYRVSAFLHQHRPAISAPLVEEYETNIRVLDRVLAEEASPEAPAYPPRPATGGLGVRPTIHTARGNQS